LLHPQILSLEAVLFKGGRSIERTHSSAAIRAIRGVGSGLIGRKLAHQLLKGCEPGTVGILP
jgi:hypothetical protein